MTDNKSDAWHAEFEQARAAVDAEQRRVGVTYDDLLPLFLDDAPSNLEHCHMAGGQVFLGPISFDDQLAVLQSLPTGAGRDGVLRGFSPYRARKSANRYRDV